MTSGLRHLTQKLNQQIYRQLSKSPSLPFLKIASPAANHLPTEEQLKGAPKYNKVQAWNWGDRENDRRIYNYYNTPLWY